MNFWVTAHWPPRSNDNDSEREIGVWIPDGREEAASELQCGDLVAVYETRSGRTEIRELQDGTILKTPFKTGREGIICYGTATGPITAIPDSQPQKYWDNTEINWKWHTGLTIMSRSGFVARAELNRILDYSPTYNLRGFGDRHSGLKRVSESQFQSIRESFHASCPIELPTVSEVPRSRPGDGHEGDVHLNLKNYIAADPASALNESGLRTLRVEFEFATGDRADIVLADSHNRIIGVEIEPAVADFELPGPLQAIKYRHMLECVSNRESGDSRGMLIAHSISSQIKDVCAKYGVETYEVSYESVEAWLAERADHCGHDSSRSLDRTDFADTLP